MALFSACVLGKNIDISNGQWSEELWGDMARNQELGNDNGEEAEPRSDFFCKKTCPRRSAVCALDFHTWEKCMAGCLKCRFQGPF